MAKYHVYCAPSSSSYILDVQTDLLDALNTRVVVPLMPLSDAPTAAKRLNPNFDIGGESYMMVTQFMAAVPTSILKDPVCDLSDHFADITAALDMVFQGF